MRLMVALFLTLATPLSAATERTGDIVDGTPVIAQLDIGDLDAGRIHRFWFRVTDTSVGQGWYVPVIVVKGAKPGPRFLLTAGIHGDELNGVAVAHRMATSFDPATLNGTVTIIAGLNTPGLINGTRSFTPSGGVGDNLNRLMPGKEDATDISDRYAGRLWARLMRPNADTVVDLHTQSRGTAYVMYAFAETKRARAMAELYAPDIVKLDRGVKGAVETEFNRIGIPAITLELGYPEVFDEAMIARAVAGTRRLMVDLKMLPTAPSAAVQVAKPFVANSIVPVRTTRGGYVTRLVGLNEDVAKDQPVATVADPFGRIVETVRAPVAGRVNTVATDPTREAGDMVVRLVWWSNDPKCAAGC